MTAKNPVNIKGFLETSFLDWPGMVSSVLFLPGCNFRCPFCHNAGLVTEHDRYPSLPWVDIKQRLCRFRGWIDGVVISGGEPTLSPGLETLIREIKDSGFMVKLDTNGSRPEIIRDLIAKGLIDQVAMDVKAPLNEDSYSRAAGRPGFLGPVSESLQILASMDVSYTLRTTIVPEIHSEDDVLLLARQLQNAPEWTLQNFEPQNALDCSLRRVTPWDSDHFQKMCARAREVHRGLV
jgi:pyruvate formate lyase activating enzyme